MKNINIHPRNYRRDNLHGIAAFDWVQMIEFAEKLFGCSRNCKEQ